MWKSSTADESLSIQVSTLKEGTIVRIREDEELVKLLNCRVGWKTEMQAVSGSHPHHAVVTGRYIEYCGCEWFKSSLCCSYLLYWTLSLSGSNPDYVLVTYYTE